FRDRRVRRARRCGRSCRVADREADHRGLLHQASPGAAMKGIVLPRATIGVSRWRRVRAAGGWPLILTIIALCAIGLLNLYSATRGTRHHAKFDTQVQWMLVGAVCFIAATIIDYRTLVRLAWIGLGAAIVLLIVVRLLGDAAHG